MRASGLAALRKRIVPRTRTRPGRKDSTELSGDECEIKPDGWRFFRAQPTGTRTSAFWVMSAKRPETREARFAVLLASSEAGTRIPLLRRVAHG